MEQISNEEILNVLFDKMPDDHRVLLCTVAGDPSTVERWPGVPWRLGARVPLLTNRNNYATVSAFGPDEGGVWRRRKDQFKGMFAIMVDDIGTKIDVRSLPDILRPTLLVETSPGNYQATFKLSEPIYDQGQADDLIKSIIAKVAPGGVDPGMAGVTRVMRLPVGINGKPKYIRDGEIWRCKVARWKPDVVMSFDELAKAFSMVRSVATYIEPSDALTVERKRGFEIVLAGVTLLGLVKRPGRGWVDVVCPWVNTHTDKASTGSAIALPAKVNGWTGGYRCHHGHCQNKGWSDLEDYVTDALVRLGGDTRGPFRGGVAPSQ